MLFLLGLIFVALEFEFWLFFGLVYQDLCDWVIMLGWGLFGVAAHDLVDLGGPSAVGEQLFGIGLRMRENRTVSRQANLVITFYQTLKLSTVIMHVAVGRAYD